MSVRGLNLLVFRDGRRRVKGADLKLALLEEPNRSSGASSTDVRISALLRAGELECAIADADAHRATPFVALTDALAKALVDNHLPGNFEELERAVAESSVPEELSVSTAEGFAYYALHPLAYSRVLEKLLDLRKRVVVIGIRSIGATLSAVTAAAAQSRGLNAVRFTVRPAGHPYNRYTEFLPCQLQVIQSGIAHQGQFLIVDEGPGLSGSSFLSVAEALERAGVARQDIFLLCAHEPNPNALCSANAAERWRRFRHETVTGQACVPSGDFIGGGQWRNRLFQDESVWPPIWSTMERVKYLVSADSSERRLFKFGGFGHYGDPVFEREQRVAVAGFGPMPRLEESGFLSYPWLRGRAMAPNDLSREVIHRLAEYCAFRVQAFAIDQADLKPLQEMADHNLAELGFRRPVSLTLEHPVIADGHMQPHEWVLTQEGQIFKTDSGSHGDDHFYPGPTDIAWDLAGAMVEWQMNAAQSEEFLQLYRRASGDNPGSRDPGSRIDDFVRAYTVFRCAYCRMAANVMQGAAEQARLEQASAIYAASLEADSGSGWLPAEESEPAKLPV
ncbi:MAG TPA: hypothetical protein VKH81_21270 [Candidatus Angelobacter sp.]|nr:hypothetical protein [Candidatus Angelobacter sp.]